MSYLFTDTAQKTLGRSTEQKYYNYNNNNFKKFSVKKGQL